MNNSSRLSLKSSVNVVHPNVTITQGAVVCDSVELIGEIYIGTNTIIHPHASIIAKSGPIIIGDFCVIEEQAKIINDEQENEKRSNSVVMIIGSYNYFQVDCLIEARNIGDENNFECKCFVGKQMIIPNKCSIGAGCKFDGDVKLEDRTVVIGENCVLRKNISEDFHKEELKQQIRTLKEYLPRNHFCLKCNKTR